MKIVVPLEENAGRNSKVCEHFGSAPWFGVVDEGGESVKIMENPNSNHEHGQCTPADAFITMGANAVVCNGIGARAASKLQMIGIDIYIAGLAPTLDEALRRFAEGKLVRMSERQACEGHDCH